MVRIENKNYDGLIIDTIFHLKKKKGYFWEILLFFITHYNFLGLLTNIVVTLAYVGFKLTKSIIHK